MPPKRSPALDHPLRHNAAPGANEHSHEVSLRNAQQIPLSPCGPWSVPPRQATNHRRATIRFLPPTQTPAGSTGAWDVLGTVPNKVVVDYRIFPRASSSPISLRCCACFLTARLFI